jgi:ABC-type phosphate/phosphonate transport system permease subunit
MLLALRVLFRFIKTFPPFAWVLTFVRENPYVPQTAQLSRFIDID